jgi:hypothetical protein
VVAPGIGTGFVVGIGVGFVGIRLTPGVVVVLTAGNGMRGGGINVPMDVDVGL